MAADNARMEFEDVAPVLEAAGMAAAREEPLPINELADELGRSRVSVEMLCAQLESTGLVLFAGVDERNARPILTRAGRQYLALKGAVHRDALRFLPRVVDDLHAREALMLAGTALVDDFRTALVNGDGSTTPQTSSRPRSEKRSTSGVRWISSLLLLL
jgi:hypothetical protein